MAALRNRAGHYVFVMWFLYVFVLWFLSSIFYLFSSPNLSGRRLDVYTILRHMVWPYSANLECRSETGCTRLAGNAGPKKSPKSRHLGIITQYCRDISAQLRYISTIGKNILSSNTSSTCPHNMVNFGPLATEIGPVVWGTSANFNGFASWQRYCTALW